MNIDEDKKRRDINNSDDRPTKRMLSSSEASVKTATEIDPKDQNILQFQNRAMKVRVEELKFEVNDRDNLIKSLNTKIHTFEEIVSYLCRAWDQLNDGLNLLSLKVGNESDLDELLPNDRMTESFQFLNQFIQEPESIEEGYQFENTFQQKVLKTQSIFSRVSLALEREHTLSTVIFRLLKTNLINSNSPDLERLLRDDNDKLSKQNQLFQLVYDKLYSQYKQLSDQSSKYLDQIGTYNQEIRQLKSDMERMGDELNIERKRVVKLSDESLKLPSSLVKLPSPVLNSSTLSLNSSTNSTGPPGTPKISSDSLALNTNSISNSSSNGFIKPIDEDLIGELNKLAENRLNEARKLREEKANLTKELQQLQLELKIIPEEKVLTSIQYQVLRQRAQFMTEELDIHRQQCQKLQNDLNQANIGRRIEREQIEGFELQRRQALERRAQQLEGENIELKQDKEKLIEMFEPRNQNIPSQEYIHESRVLLDAKDKDIKKLSQEVAQLKQELSKLTDSKNEIQKYQDQSKSQIEFKNLELNDLKCKLEEISKINEDLLAKEKQALERERELNLTLEEMKSSIQGNLDYVQLKVSESKLKEELEGIRKQFEEIESLKEKHKTDTEHLTNSFKSRINELEATLTTSIANQDSQKQELEALIGEIDSMGKEYEQMQEQNTRLIKQLSEREDTYAQLMAENIKSQQSIRNTKEMQIAMEEKMLRSEDKLKNQTDIMMKIDEKAKHMQNQLSKITEDLHLCNFELEKNKRLVREYGAQSIELKTQLDHMGLLNSELKKKADDSIFALEREIDKAKRLDEEKQSLKKKLEKSPSSSSSTSGANNNNNNNNISAEDEIRIINDRLRCSICNDRQKNTVIAKCFHVFCKECIQSNIDTRKRRCPGCNRPFAETDIHQIFI